MFDPVIRIMAYYYKFENPELQEFENQNTCEKDLILYANGNANSDCEPLITYDFSKYVLIELLDDFTPVKKIWDLLGFSKNKAIIRKRIMLDPHRLKCRRVVAICSSSESAREIVNTLAGKKIGDRCICTVVVEDLLGDIKLFENEIRKYGDTKPQQKLVYVSNLNRCRRAAGLVSFLNEKFSFFGTIISILVSEDNDGYALGEAVIRFSYFSEAFAAELAYDECVIGKERLHVTMQHNIILCECDLRARLRESLRSYQSEIAVVPSFRPSVSSRNSSSNEKINLLTVSPNMQAVSRNIILDACKEYQNNNSVELICCPETSDKEEVSSSEKCGVYAPLKCKQVNQIPKTTDRNDTFQLSDNFQINNSCNISSNSNDSSYVDSSSSTENANKSWSTKIIDWVRNFVNSTDNSLEKNSGNKSFVCTNEQILVSNDFSTTENHECVSSILSPPLSNFLNTNEINSSSNLRGLNHNETGVHQVCSSTKENLVSFINEKQNGHTDFNSDCQTILQKGNLGFNQSDVMNDDKENFYAGNYSITNCKQMRKKARTANLKTVQFNSEYSIVTRSKKRHLSDPLLEIHNLSQLQVDNLNFDDLSKLPEKSKRVQKKANSSSSVNNNACSSNFQKKQMVPQINYTSQNLLESCEETLKSLSISKESFYNSLYPRYLSKESENVKETIHEGSLFEQSVYSQSNLNHKTSVNNNKSKIITTENSQLLKKNSRLDKLHLPDSKCPLIYISPSSSHHNFEHLKSDIASESPDSSILESPIRWWLRQHLLYSVNNRVTANVNNPNGIVYATMNKDMFIRVGCSNMTCDNCYPGATNIIFGLK